MKQWKFSIAPCKTKHMEVVRALESVDGFSRTVLPVMFVLVGLSLMSCTSITNSSSKYSGGVPSSVERIVMF